MYIYMSNDKRQQGIFFCLLTKFSTKIFYYFVEIFILIFATIYIIYMPPHLVEDLLPLFDEGDGLPPAVRVLGEAEPRLHLPHVQLREGLPHHNLA